MAIERLIFVRHGESRHHVDGLTGGWSDTPLTDRGRRQAAGAARHLASLDLSGFALVTSDLARANETAEIIGGAIEREPLCVEALREINNGEATGLSLVEAQQIASPPPAEADLDWAAYPGAESLRALDARMRDALAQLTQARHERLVVVGHGLSDTVLMKAWLGIPLLPYVAFNLAPASVSELAINEWDERCLERLNCQYGEA